MLKGKWTAFTAIVIITRSGGGIGNIQSQSKFPFAGSHTASEPVSPLLYFAPHPIHPVVPSEHPRLVCARCLPSVTPLFPLPWDAQQSPLSKSDGSLLFPLWETPAVSLLLSDGHLPCVGASQAPSAEYPSPVSSILSPAQIQLTWSYKSSFLPAQHAHPLAHSWCGTIGLLTCLFSQQRISFLRLSYCLHKLPWPSLSSLCPSTMLSGQIYKTDVG